MLCDNALKIVFAGNLEQRFPVMLDMVAIEQSIRTLNQEAQSTFPLYERCVVEVITLAPQEVEGTKTGLSAMEEKFIELRLAVVVQRNNLRIQHSGVSLQFIGDSSIERAEGLELVSVSGD